MKNFGKPETLSHKKNSDALLNVSHKPASKLETGKAAVGVSVKAFDAPMHAAKGNDDIMSQPQASQIGKKKS